MPTLPSAPVPAGLANLCNATAHVAMIAVDAAHCVVVFNRGAERLLGYAAEEVLGKSVNNILAHPADLDRFTVEMIAVVGSATSDELALFESYLKRVPAARWEWRYRHKQGHRLVIAQGMELLRDEAGAPLAMLGIATDVTAVKRREAELGARERLSHHIFETSHDAILLFEDGALLDCNSRALEMFRIDRAVLAQTHPGELSPPTQPDGRVSLVAAKEYAARAFREGYVTFEWVHRRYDGEEFPCEVVLSTFQYGGRRVLQGCLRDITDRKRAETELSQSRELFAQFMENFPGYAYLKDQQLRFVYINKEYGDSNNVDVSACLGKTIQEMYPSEFADIAHQNDLRVQERREAVSFTEKVTRADGGERFYLCYKFPVLVSDKTCMLGGISMDITAIKLLERQLADAKQTAEEAAKAKGFFLANMSHEIRTPLNGILCMLDLLADTVLNEEQADSLRIVRQSADALLGIVDDILDFSKIESGKLELENIDFNLQELLAGVVETFAARAQQKSLVVQTRIVPDTLLQLRGDAQRLRQILLNLLSNAIKFTEAGTVQLSASSRLRNNRPWIEVQVRDSGIGIPASALPRLFQSFSQVEASTTRRYGGSGLGLVICRQLIELMGGTIQVESELGRGSCFTVRLPLKQAGPPLAAPPQAAPIKASPRGGLRILVVDDNTVNRTVASKALEKLGHSVALAVNGEEALHKWHSYHFDLVFMDCQMPVMDGYEAVQRMREVERDEGRRHQIVVAMTASALPEERAHCLSVGMDDFLAKPVKLAALEAVIEHWLAPAPESTASA